jgi:hypothetical protein
MNEDNEWTRKEDRLKTSKKNVDENMLSGCPMIKFSHLAPASI